MGQTVTAMKEGAECAALRRFVEGNPAYRDIALALVRACREERPVAEAARLAAQAAPAKAQRLQRPETVARTLAEQGVLESRAYVDGEPCDPAELAQRDDLPESATVAYTLQATPEALRIAAALQPEHRLAALLDEPEHQRGALVAILEAARARGGLARTDIDELLEDSPALERDERTGIPRFYPSYFTGLLEHAGGLVWNGAWRATEPGLDFLDSLSRRSCE
ncbi:hypothetical protein C1878_11810 [Gordonibacter sp. 28C]|uniref:hypothetical protein n=1 Tax=Gordonibacter sp. 28C TaxID=2078569 RepID=UPI000DF84DBB|nr:hypothetical protein [Gordonibacter sp. 28C]RDB61394.1 hypothetical protein C1878_11810 [Gordonibacter sp. 28C]